MSATNVIFRLFTNRRAARIRRAGLGLLVLALLGGLAATPLALAQNSDSDGDGLFDDAEALQHGTDPFNPDTDGDATSDGLEIASGTDPRTPAAPGAGLDVDGDGLRDFDEVNIFGTDPVDYDTDQDGTPDGAETTAGTDPLVAAAPGQGLDTDGDGLSDADEAYVLKTNPEFADSDADGIDDGEELRLGLNPNSADAPVEIGPSPLDLDADDDGLTDFDEQAIWGTDPFDSDTDGDAFNDGFESSRVNLDPLDPDSDDDGMADGCDDDPTTPSGNPDRGCTTS